MWTSNKKDKIINLLWQLFSHIWRNDNMGLSHGGLLGFGHTLLNLFVWVSNLLAPSLTPCQEFKIKFVLSSNNFPPSQKKFLNETLPQFWSLKTKESCVCDKWAKFSFALHRNGKLWQTNWFWQTQMQTKANYYCKNYTVSIIIYF